MKKLVGAGDGGRTHTVLLPRDFESRVSANSTTPAKFLFFCKKNGVADWTRTSTVSHMPLKHARLPFRHSHTTI